MASFSAKTFSSSSVAPSLEMINLQIQHARKIRAQAFKAFVANLFSGKEAANADTSIHTLASSLAAIRSAAELLRDNPTITATERRRFIDIVLTEEERLEKFLPNTRGNGVQAA